MICLFLLGTVKPKIFTNYAVYDINNNILTASKGIKIYNFEKIKYLECDMLRCIFKAFKIHTFYAKHNVHIALDDTDLYCQKLSWFNEQHIEFHDQISIIKKEKNARIEIKAKRGKMKGKKLILTGNPTVQIIKH